MLARLGRVLYWLGCIIASVIVALDAYMWVMIWQQQGELGYSIFFVVIAFLVWLVGRLCRYLLAEA
jgi:hypothetical protein